MAKTAHSLRCPRSASTPFWLQATLRSRFYSPTTNLVEAQAGKPNIPASSQGRHRSARCSPKAPPPLPPGCGWGKRPLSVSCRMTAYAYAELFTSAAPTPSGNHPAPEAAAGAPAAREAPAKGSRLWLDAVPGRAGGRAAPRPGGPGLSPPPAPRPLRPGASGPRRPAGRAREPPALTAAAPRGGCVPTAGRRGDGAGAGAGDVLCGGATCGGTDSLRRRGRRQRQQQLLTGRVYRRRRCHLVSEQN